MLFARKTLKIKKVQPGLNLVPQLDTMAPQTDQTKDMKPKIKDSIPSQTKSNELKLKQQKNEGFSVRPILLQWFSKKNSSKLCTTTQLKIFFKNTTNARNVHKLYNKCYEFAVH